MHLLLASDSAGQERRMCCRVPSSPLQPGSLHRPSGLDLDQWRIRRSVRYLPESILADTVAFVTSKGLPAVVQIGWGEERDMNAGLKYSRESRCSASPWNLVRHQSNIFSFVSLFQ